MVQENKIKELCIFLKLLFETTKKEYREINLAKILLDLNMPYYNNISTVLIQNKLILAQRTNKKTVIYKWNTSEPNISMAITILEKCKLLHLPNKPLWKIKINEIGLIY